ncbi:hypothetical protein [Halotia branconii]|uniref:PTPA-CTERM sorting domain-containing protein n=1 Tax=Halotia branconii CENA392 TaxID=1539056 RepID=A0AAJ6P9F9_9CYAN|nr:hypothetical protein [Halotia branconii]WGV25691.1 hypothetical protein QI031_28890 [Halotia branconii CENA392]
MKFKTVCASIVVATSMTTGAIFISQAHVLAQANSNKTEQANSKASKSLEIQWFLGFIPWFKWTSDSNSPSSQNSSNSTTYVNNSNKPKLTNIGSSNRSKPISTEQGYNHKEVPVPLLIPGLAALGVGLIRKHRQEQKQMEMK